MGANSSCSPDRRNLTAEDIVKECGEDSNVKRLHILVTGATSGIGIETARVLALAGAKVYLMGRSETKLQAVIDNINKELREKSSTGSTEGVVCDLDSLASIKQFAEKFTQNQSPLNILILNAGVFNPSFAKTVDGLEQDMGINHIGHAYLTQLLMPTLIANAPSRVVVLSSAYHRGSPINYEALDRMNSTAKDAPKGWGMTSGYQQSKLANLLFARALASRYNDKNVTAYSLHPGVIDTNLISRIPFANIATLVYRKKTLAQGAATTVFCALKPGLENETGKYFDDSTVTDLAAKWTDDDVNKLWEWTEKVIHERTANL